VLCRSWHSVRFGSVISFVIPTAKTVTFWISYIFTVIAFVVQIVIWKVSFDNKKSLKSKFLGLPIAQIGIFYLAIQIISFAIFLFLPTLPIWSVVITSLTILCISALCMIVSDVGRGEIERVSTKVHEKTSYIKQLQIDVELMADAEIDTKVKVELRQLAEKIRFSDPMSHETLAELENQLTMEIYRLKTSTDKTKAINEINLLLDERNKKCKLIK
jgi:hypothetical protein